MYKKTTLILLVIFFVFSCEVQFDRNIRIETTGKTVDENSIAIPNLFVGVFTEAARFIGFYPTLNGDREYLLGSSNSDENGDFSVTSLFDSDQDFFIFVDGGDSRTNYIYSSDTFDFEPQNFIFNLDEVSLKKKANINLNITRTSALGTALDFYISYQSPLCEEVFVNGVLDEALSNCNRVESVFRTLNDDSPNYEKTSNSFITGTIEFGYSINGGAETIETFIINQENYDINFSY
ncbi:hypothetical protein [Lacinutrix algicola]|uniref:hypothetical protein n=1 Tax=Lacinutrix algicola TaxID=342954 RepID=UPI0006E2050C|nr:hypothetical protein [Lacinutrix algicola]